MKKLSLSLLSFILVSIIALGWVMDALVEEFFLDSDDDPIAHYETLGKQLADALDTTENPEDFIKAWQRQDQNDLFILARDALPLPPELWTPLENGEPLILETEAGLTLYYWLNKRQRLLAFTPVALQTDDGFAYLNLILTSIFYLCVLALLFLWLLPLIKSLRQLRKNALEYGQGNFSARMPTGQLTYIGDIEKTFNQMADQIASLIQDNKLISSAVSHDLRTPLARLRFGIDILSETEDSAERDKYQEHLSNDIDEMQLLVEALLSYAKLEQSLITLDKADVNISNLIFAFQKSHPQGLVDLEINDRIFVSGQETYLKMVIHNILNNGLHYGGGKVFITSSFSHDSVDLVVHDNGPGVPVEKREDLFKPFVRGDQTVEHSGYGMGLAIAQRIAQWHGGQVSVTDSDQLKGAAFTIRLPLSQAA